MSKALEEARRGVRLAAKQVEQVAQGTAIEDPNPTGDPDIDRRRMEAITELERPLTPEESFSIAAGLPHDFKPPQPPGREPDPDYDPTEHPEHALSRKAAAKAAADVPDRD